MTKNRQKTMKVFVGGRVQRIAGICQSIRCDTQLQLCSWSDRRECKRRDQTAGCRAKRRRMRRTCVLRTDQRHPDGPHVDAVYHRPALLDADHKQSISVSTR